MNHLEQLKRMSNAKNYEKDTVIVQEGDTGDDMYIILKGQAVVYKNYRKPNEIKLTTLTPGNFFGEMSLFLCKNRTATVVAHDQVITLCINRKNAFELFKLQPEFTFSLITSLCTRLDNANLVYEKQLNEKLFSPEPVKSGEEQLLAKAEASGSCSIFPEGHGSYTLPIDNTQAEYLYDKSQTCPICSHSFKELAIRKSKLVNERVEPDMRVRYKNIEPLYYDIITCPKCRYSALGSVFSTAKPNSSLSDELASYTTEFVLQNGVKRDTFTVFAGYYLALKCAPLCFNRSQAISGKLWFNLSQLYNDCGDEHMERHAVEQALKNYMFAYERIDMSDEQSSRLGVLIGELNYKLGDLASARKFFFQAKRDKATTDVLKRQAENRLGEIRDLMKNESAL